MTQLQVLNYERDKLLAAIADKQKQLAEIDQQLINLALRILKRRGK